MHTIMQTGDAWTVIYVVNGSGATRNIAQCPSAQDAAAIASYLNGGTGTLERTVSDMTWIGFRVGGA